MTDFKMSSNRPYLLRAMYEWIVDNQCTPHLLVDARDARVKVPREHVRDGQIVLNINPSAVGQFHWDNEHIEFSARFAGVARNMWIPMTAVLAIYARENGEGMAFTTDTDAGADEQDEASDAARSSETRPGETRLIETTSSGTAPSEAAEPRPALAPVSTTTDAEPPIPPTPPSPPAGGGRSHLKVVK